MHPFPHRYAVSAMAGPASVVTLRSAELEDIQSTPPPEFDGPAGNWSPETLFVAAIADCYILSFRAVADASKLEWNEIDVDAVGVLEKTTEGLWFTVIELGGEAAHSGRRRRRAGRAAAGKGREGLPGVEVAALRGTPADAGERGLSPLLEGGREVVEFCPRAGLGLSQDETLDAASHQRDVRLGRVLDAVGAAACRIGAQLHLGIDRHRLSDDFQRERPLRLRRACASARPSRRSGGCRTGARGRPAGCAPPRASA